ncbi:DNA methylase family protein [Schaalia georgiae F0490]|uniref:DNA methylase family protein n=1 Tax=Schaalia georgiae F0490 TaxID=1125717 RepID=J1GQV5_9ACTO|nr:site-specific DNA-methyltransferase [Schaalia georgiae]EJF35360.1 DNA methylase family protein [Schaalia georgiae F0490]
MSVYYEDDVVTVHHGDCIEVMRGLPSGSVDSVVTDPPYGIRFMGQAWDGADIARRTQRGRDNGGQAPAGARGPHGGYRSASVEAGRYSRSMRDAHAFQEWCAEWAAECLRVLKPGGLLLAFGGSRTWHRLACAVEDAGFEVRDSIAWLYGNGFPKSVNVGAAVDASLGLRRQVATRKKEPPRDKASGWGFSGDRTTTVPASAEARAWDGWGTALKPGFEPCVVARRPLDGTVADNVLDHGVGGININACRLRSDAELNRTGDPWHSEDDDKTYTGRTKDGRWPTNVVLDEEAARALDAATPESVSRQGKPRAAARSGEGWGMRSTGAEYDDQGGPSRFFPVFRYEAKASSDERPSVGGVSHPTVKPIALMRWLVRLVTPYGGLVLDPFAGSGTTIEAAVAEGMRAVGVEREESYLPLIASRLDRPVTPVLDLGIGGL